MFDAGFQGVGTVQDEETNDKLLVICCCNANSSRNSNDKLLHYAYFQGSDDRPTPFIFLDRVEDALQGRRNEGHLQV